MLPHHGNECSKNKTARRWSLAEVVFWIHAMLDLFRKKKVAVTVCSQLTLCFIGERFPTILWFCPCFGGGVGLDDPQRSLPTPTILWFCDMLINLFTRWWLTALNGSSVHYKLLPCNFKCTWKQPPQNKISSLYLKSHKALKELKSSIAFLSGIKGD